MRILLAEDEAKVASFLARGLEAEGHAVEVAADGETALSRLTGETFDLAILDVGLPRRDGLSVLGEIRRLQRRLPVLVLTARDSVADRVAGLDAGADDYLSKPFAFDELLARVRALLRRGSAAAPSVLQIADLRLDPATREVTRAGRRIELTAREFALLEYFLRHPGRVLSRARIAENVWGTSYDTFTNVIDVYVNYLRKKVDAGFEPRLLHTVRGAGYVLRLPAEAEP